MIAASAHFGNSPRAQLLEWQRHQQQLEQARQQAQRKEKDMDEANDADIVAAVVTVTTDQQIKILTERLNQFDDKLDRYNQASTEALIEAHKQLDIVREQLKNVRRDLDVMRANAFELEDGTKILVSEDETWAIDLDGNEVDIERVPLEEIPDPTKIAGKYRDKLEESNKLSDHESKLETRIEAIHAFDDKRMEFEARSGDIRDTLESDEVLSDEESQALQDELDAMDEELNAIMPPAIRAHVNGVSNDTVTPNIKAAFDDKAIPTNDVAEQVKPSFAAPVMGG